MNWFTNGFVSNRSYSYKSNLVETWGGCDHVLADPDTLYVVQYENDSMGKEGYCMCEACYTMEQKEGDERIVVCQDCKQKFPKSETFEWKPYDFYAAQGDEPAIICKSCGLAERHLARVKKDQEDCEWEMMMQTKVTIDLHRR